MRVPLRATRVWAAVLCALLVAVLLPSGAQAVVVDPMTRNYTAKVYGDFILVGNGVLTCQGQTNCNSLNTGSGSINNDSFNMRWVDVDSNAATANSSSATLTVPTGASVVKAQLFWAGNTGYSWLNGRQVNGCTTNAAVTIPTAQTKESVILSTAGGTTAVTGTVVTEQGGVHVGDDLPIYYSASADVTTALQSLPKGSTQTVTVGNLFAPQGQNCFAGWALQLVYDFGAYQPGNTASQLREIYQWSGHNRLSGGDPEQLLYLDGLAPQGTGSRAGFVAYEGDAGISGDYLRYEDETTSVVYLGMKKFVTQNAWVGFADGAVNYTTSTGDFYNGSVDVYSRNIGNLLVPGDEWLRLRLGTSQDAYGLQDVIVSVPVADVQIFKTAANGDTTQVLLPGETPQYKITLYNSGGVALTGLRVDDPAVPACARASGVIPDLAIGASYTFTCSGLPTTVNAAGEYINNASVYATSSSTEPVAVSNNSTTVVQFADVEVAKAAKNPTIPIGTAPTWIVTVTNEGTAVLRNVVVSDPTAPNCVRTFPQLQPGDVQTYECTGPVTSTTTSNTVSVSAEASSANGAVKNVVETSSGGPTNPKDEFLNNTASVQVTDLTVAKTVAGGENAYVAPGSTVTWTITVTNTGTSTIRPTVADPLAPNCVRTGTSLPQLAPAASTSYTCTSVVSAGTTNTATATATPVAGGTSVTKSDTARADTIALTLDKTAATTDTNGSGQLDQGDTVAYSFLVTNTGSAALTNIALSDPMLTGLSCPVTTLAAGASTTCTATAYTVTQADVQAGTLANTATVTGRAPNATTVSAQDTVTLSPVQNPRLALTKTASPTTISAVGQVVTYTFTGTNTGNVSLTGVQVTDSMTGLSALSCPPTAPAVLAPGATIRCTATRTTTQADLNAGTVTNTATVAGVGPRGTAVTASAQATVTATQNPAVTLTKSPSPGSYNGAGQTITYTLTARNSGNVNLTGVRITDPRLPTLSCAPAQPATLSPGATLTCTGTYTTTQADIDSGALTNTATVSATGPAGQAVSATRSAVVTANQNAAIDLTKTPDRTSVTSIGQVITYTLRAVNTGNQTLTNVRISDPKTGMSALSCVPTQPATLAPGESVRCSATYTTTQADLNAGGVTNSATAASRSPGSTTDNVTDGATATVTATQNPAIRLTKQASPSTTATVGSTTTYTFVLQNTGNVRLNAVALSDPVAGLSTPSCTPTALGGVLDPGASTTCTATRTVTQADANAGSVPNTATAAGTTDLGTRVTTTASATVTVTQSPALTLDKTNNKPGGIGTVGEQVTYTLTARNTGNVTLSRVSISDSNATLGTCVPTQPATLAPGATLVCTATRAVTQADLDSGSLLNTATARGDEPKGNPDTPADDILATDSDVVTANRAPAIELTETVSAATYDSATDVLTYTFVVRNPGNVTLTDVRLTDTLPSLSSISCPGRTLPTTLAPGAQITCTATRVVGQDAVDSGSVTNSATAGGLGPAGTRVSDTDSVTSTAQRTPAVTVSKVASPTTVTAVGQTVTYTYTVTNAGNVTLTNPRVSDPHPALSALTCTPAASDTLTLAPGATMTCRATYVSTQADLDAGSIIDTATVSATPPAGPAVTAQDGEVVAVTQTPRLVFTKTASPSRVTTLGEQVTYTFTVTNTGNVTATDVVITDPKQGLSALDCTPTQPASLAPGATLRCTATRATTQANLDAGSFSNTATLNANRPDGTALPAQTATATVQVTRTPALAVTKVGPATASAADGQIAYTVTIRNSGNVTVTGMGLTDSLAGASIGTCTPALGGSLAPGASITCPVTKPITQADLDEGEVVNTATATATSPTGPVQASGTWRTALATNPNMTFAKTVAPTTVTAAGQQVTYTFTIRNTGDVTLAGVGISDPIAGLSTPACDAAASAPLAPGEVRTCTATRTVTQDELDFGSVTNTATATAADPQGGTLTRTDDAVVTATQQPGLSVVKRSDITSFSTVGTVIGYDVTLTNTGNVALGDVRMTDSLPGLRLVGCTPALGSALAPGAQMICHAEYTTTQADLDAGGVENTAAGSAQPPSGARVGGSDDHTVLATRAPRIDVTKTASPSTVTAAGEVVTYTITVTNSGNQTLSGVRASDTSLPDMSAVTCGSPGQDGSLAPGAAMTCTATRAATLADVNTGAWTNTASATGTDPAGTAVSDTGSATVRSDRTPAFTLSKVADPASVSRAGDAVTYTFTATNTGNVTITDVRVRDPLAGLSTLACIPVLGSALDPGGSMRCTASRTATQTDIDTGTIANTATLDGIGPTGSPLATVRASATVTVAQDPQLSLAKSATPTTFDSVGQVITYRIVGENTGNVSLANSVLSDPLNGLSALSCVDRNGQNIAIGAALSPGGIKDCTGTYTVVQADLDRGFIDNTATITAEAPGGDTADPADDIRATDSLRVTAVASPLLTLTKTADRTAFTAAGQLVDYTLTASNDGNVTLTGVSIEDDLPGAATTTCTPAAPATLAPGEDLVCEVVYTTTQEDVDAGAITNNASATGTDPSGGEANATASRVVTATQTPRIDLVKTATPANVTAAGQLVTYAFSVRNTGNTTLGQVTVTDPLTGMSEVTCDPPGQGATLAPGATLTCSATRTVTQADLDAGGVSNTASVSSTGPGGAPVSDTGETTVQATLAPDLSITKRADVTQITAVGQDITYTVDVQNTGNVTLSAVTVSDSLPGLRDLSCTPDAPASLAPGAGLSCTAVYTVTQGDIDQGVVRNDARVSATDPRGIALPIEHATLDITVLQTADVTLAKSASPASVSAVGQVVTYTFLARNTGNTTLSQVLITDPIPGLSSLSCGTQTGPVSLAPGATKTCTATRATTQADLDAGSIDNTATVGATTVGAARLTRTADASVDITENPALTVTKSSNVLSLSQPGQVVRFTISVVNSGNVTLTGLGVTDDLPGLSALSCIPALGGSLAPGARVSCTASYTSTTDDFNTGSITNSATATALDRAGDTVTGGASTVVATEQSAGLDLVKEADLDSYDSVGDTITYTLTVANTGTTTITGVTVSDPALATVSCSVPLPATLEPQAAGGAVLRCTGTHVVTQADLDAGQLVNTATAEGRDVNGDPVADSDQNTVEAVTTRGVELTKTVDPATFSEVGQTLTYTFTATNTGTTTLTGITIGDRLPTLSALVCNGTAAAPGEAVECTATYTTTQADLDNGSVINDASVIATDPFGNTTQDAAAVPADAEQTYTVAIDKTAAPERVSAVGQVITYRTLVTNTGNTTLGNVFISDPKVGLTNWTCRDPATGTPSSGPVSLVPGQSKECTASYTVRQADLDDGTISNTATAASTGPNGQTLPNQSDTADVDVIEAPSMTVTKVADRAVYSQVGQVVNYTVTVANTGNVVIDQLRPSDPMLADLSCTPAAGTSLPAGTSMTCTGSHTITQAELDGTSLTNTVEVVGRADGDTAPVTLTGSASRTITAEHLPGISLEKDASPTTVTAAGQVIDYRLVATNTGNITLNKVFVSDTLTGLQDWTCVDDAGEPFNGPISLAPGRHKVCTASYTVTQADINAGFVLNDATVTGADTDGNPVSAEASERVTATRTSSVTVDKSATPTTVTAIDDAVDYAFLVTNTGNTTLTGLVVTDPLLGGPVTCPVTSLEPGVSTTCTGRYTVVQADIDRGSIPNQVDVSMQPPAGAVVTARDTNSVTVTQDPALELTKSADPDVVSSTSDVVTYTIVARNTGDTTLNNVVISDPMFGVQEWSCDKSGAVSLAPGETKTCTGRHTVTQAELDDGIIENVASVSRRLPNGTDLPPVTARADVTVTGTPAVSVTKVADREAVAAVGDVVAYTITVRNDGNISLSGIVVDDAPLADLDCRPALDTLVLAPGSSITCTGTHTTTQADLDGTGIVNTVDVTATGSNGDEVTGTASVTVTPEQDGALSLDKNSDLATIERAGQQVTYTFTATNTGNVTLTSVEITDDLPNLSALLCPGGMPRDLAPGAVLECEASYLVTQADVDAGRVVNEALVTGTDPDLASVTSSAGDEIPVQRTPLLQATKTATPATVAAAGDEITYEIVVTNAGNTTVTGVIVSDPLIPAAGLVCAPGQNITLAPGDQVTCTATRAVTQTDVNTGRVVNTARADGTSAGPTPVSTTSNQAVVTIASDPGLSIVKTAVPTEYSAVGERIDYSVVVTNTGNVSLSNVFVADTLDGIQGWSCTPAGPVTLAPGGQKTCSAFTVVDQGDLDAGSVINVAKVTSRAPDGSAVNGEDSAVSDARTSSLISLTKTATPARVNAGDEITYTFEATNTGTVTLSNVRILDTMADLGTLTCTPGLGESLAPGATVRCTATKVATEADIDLATIDNSAEVRADRPGGNPADPADDVVDGGAAQVIPYHQPELTVTKSADVASYAQPGDVIDYTMVVTNTGNAVLDDVRLVDELTGLSAPVCLPAQGATLAVGEQMTCTAQYAVTQADIDAGELENVADATGTDRNGDPLTTVPGRATVPAVQSSLLSLTKDADVTEVDSADDTIRYEFLVSNDGNTTLDLVTLTDPLPGLSAITCVPALPATLVPGGQATCQATYEVTQADVDAGGIVNSASVSARKPDGSPTTAAESDSDEVRVDVVADPALSLVKSANPTQVTQVGQSVTYTMLARNTGNVTMSGVRITDPMPGLGALTCEPGMPADLAPGATLSCTAVKTATQADVDAGGIDNTATVSGTDPDGTPLDVAAGTQVDAVQRTSVALTKTSDRSVVSRVGDVVTYAVEATNTGTVTLSGFTLVDELDGVSALSCTPALPTNLASGARVACTARYATTQGDIDAGSITNRVTATGTAPTGAPALAPTVAENVVQAEQVTGLDLVKTASVPFVDSVGEVVTYTFEATNTGNATLSAVGITDTLPGLGALSCAPALGSALAPGATMRCTAGYSVTHADLEAGQVANTATAEATGPNGAESDTDTYTVTAHYAPQLAMTKSVSAPANWVAGDEFTYTFLVSNPGTMRAQDVTITDPLPGLSAIDCGVSPLDLDPGEQATCTATYTATLADANAGALTNEATLSATEPTGQPFPVVTATARTATGTVGSVTMSKTADRTAYAAVGETITYTLTAENTGQLTLAGVTFTDPLPGLGAQTCLTDRTIDPGERFTCTVTYTIGQADLDRGSVANTATVTATDPRGRLVDPASDDEVVTALGAPSLTLTKQTDTETVRTVGTVIEYTFVLHNDGNVTITDARVTDPMPGLTLSGCGPATIAPGANLTCTGTHAVTQADLDSGLIENTATGSGTGPGGIDPADVTATETVTVERAPAITLTKAADRTVVTAAGEQITYSIVARNSGNQTLTGVQVTDALPAGAGALACVDGDGVQGQPAALTPGEELTCTVAYAPSQAVFDGPVITNVATVRASDPAGTQVGAQAQADVETEHRASLTIRKTANRTSIDQAGDGLLFTKLITNTGNVTVREIFVDDPLSDIANRRCEGYLPGQRPVLAPGESVTCYADYVATQADMDLGRVQNTAIVVGVDPSGNRTEPATSTSVVPAIWDPSMSISKTADHHSILQAGERVQYTIVGRNTGDVTLSVVTVQEVLQDRMPDYTCSPDLPAVIPPGDQIICVGTLTVTEDDIATGSIINEATMRGQDPFGRPVPDQRTSDIVTSRADALAVVKTSPTVQAVSRAGDVIPYTITVTNTSDIAVRDVTISDPFADAQPTSCLMGWQDLNGNGLVDEAPNTSDPSAPNHQVTPGPGLTLAGGDPAVPDSVGDTVACAVAHTVTQAEIDAADDLVNVATVTGVDAEGTTISGTESDTVVIDAAPGVELTKTARVADGTLDAVGDEVVYDVVATNVGNQTLTTVVVADPLLPALACTWPGDAGVLAPGQSATCTGSFTATQTTIDAGRVDNTATVSAEAPARTGQDVPVPVNDVATARVTVDQNPALSVTKSTSATEVTRVGEEVTWTVGARNDGNVSLVDVRVVESIPSASTSCTLSGAAGLDPTVVWVGTLAPGQAVECTVVTTVTQADLDAGSLANVVSAEGWVAADGELVLRVAGTATAVVSAGQQPALTMVKSVAPQVVSRPGEVVTFSFAVTNTGTVTVTGLQILDPLPGLSSPACPVTDLAPGASTTCTATYPVSAADLERGGIENTAQARAVSAGGSAEVLSGASSARVSVDAPVQLELVKGVEVVAQADGSGVTAGDRLRYTLTARNIGVITARSVTMSDPLPGLSALGCDPAAGADLPPGEAMTCTAEYTVTEDDATRGEVANVATVTAGSALDDELVSRTATVTVPVTDTDDPTPPPTTEPPTTEPPTTEPPTTEPTTPVVPTTDPSPSPHTTTPAPTATPRPQDPDDLVDTGFDAAALGGIALLLVLLGLGFLLVSRTRREQE